MLLVASFWIILAKRFSLTGEELLPSQYQMFPLIGWLNKHQESKKVVESKKDCFAYLEASNFIQRHQSDLVCKSVLSTSLYWHSAQKILPAGVKAHCLYLISSSGRSLITMAFLGDVLICSSETRAKLHPFKQAAPNPSPRCDVL